METDRTTGAAEESGSDNTGNFVETDADRQPSAPTLAVQRLRYWATGGLWNNDGHGRSAFLRYMWLKSRQRGTGDE